MNQAKYIKQWQTIIGAEPDGIFGPNTLRLSRQAADVGRITPKRWELSDSSMQRLNHPDFDPGLRRVVMHCAQRCPYPFAVFETLRTIERQREYLKRGVSKTLNSRHLTGHAVDLVPLDADGKLDWMNQTRLEAVAKQMRASAAELGYPLTSGGLHWGWDWYHFQRRWGA